MGAERRADPNRPARQYDRHCQGEFAAAEPVGDHFRYQHAEQNGAPPGDHPRPGAGLEIKRRPADYAAGDHQAEANQHQTLVAIALAEVTADQGDDDARCIENTDQGAKLGITDAEILDDERAHRTDRLKLIGPCTSRNEQHR